MKKIICGIVYAVLCFAAGAAVAAMSGTSWSTTTYDDGKNREVVISNDVTEISASGLITVSKNSKLLIRLNDNVDHDVTIKLSKKNTAGFLSLDSGATVQVKGNADHRIVLDGGAAFPEEPRAEDVDELGRPNNPQALRFYSTTGHKIDNSFIRCSGKATLDLNGVIVQNVYHYSDEDKESKPGGAIHFMKEQQAFVSLTNCVIRKCRAKLGAAILAHTSTSGTLTIQDTDINWCVNMVDGKDADWAINGGTIRSWANSSVMLNMKNVKMHHNYSHMNAGALYWNAMRDDDTYATVDGCVFEYNYARGGGGACFICGPLEFCGNETVVCRNTCKGETGESKDHGDGGGICVQVYSAEAAPHHAVNLHSMFGSCLTVYENTAKRGGGISYYYGDSSLYDGSALQLIVNGCKIYNNSASELGGGLYVENAEQNKNRIDFAFDFNSGIISNNMSAAEGGGVYISGGAVTFTGGQVVNNASATRGGGLFIKDCTADILVNTNGSQLLVADNVATNGGGLAIWGTKVAPKTVSLEAGVFKSNRANDGGGIYITNALLSATGGNVISNAAIRGGGICLGVDGHATFDGTMNVSYNVATNLGGGVAMNYNSTLSITNGTFSFNQAQMGGGAHLLGGAKLTIIGGDFFCNRAVYREGTDLVHVGSRGQTSSTNWPTAWHTERYDLCSGVGGGIYLGKGSDGKLTTLDCPKNDRVGIVGAYSNIADRAGNEIVSAGLYTKVNLPNRVLTNEVGQILTWFEDYYTSPDGTSVRDTHYTDRWLNAPTGTVESMRYMVARLTGQQQHVPETTAETEGAYLCLALGYGVDSPVRSLWITDHADAGTFDGTNWVNLAFTPVFDATNKVRVADWFLRAKARGWIKYATALDEASFADAPLMTDFRYRDGHGTNDIDKGWVWLTVPMPDERPALTNRLWKIYVDDTADTTAQN